MDNNFIQRVPAVQPKQSTPPSEGVFFNLKISAVGGSTLLINRAIYVNR